MRLLLASLILLAPAWQAAAPKPALQPRTIEGRQLSIVTSQSAMSAAPGARVSLFVDVMPKPKMHVYAPEQTGEYIRITLDLDENRAFRTRRTIFPKASDYYFAPLEQTFKVFAKPFRIRQDLTLAESAALRRRASAGGPLAITGTLRYQACDDEVCYRPQEIKVAWTLALKARMHE